MNEIDGADTLLMSNDEIIDFLTQIELELMSSNMSTRPRHNRDASTNDN